MDLPPTKNLAYTPTFYGLELSIHLSDFRYFRLLGVYSLSVTKTCVLIVINSKLLNHYMTYVWLDLMSWRCWCSHRQLSYGSSLESTRASLTAWFSVSPALSQSSLTLSSHVFRRWPLHLCRWIRPFSKIFGSWQSGILSTCPKYFIILPAILCNPFSLPPAYFWLSCYAGALF